MNGLILVAVLYINIVVLLEQGSQYSFAWI